MDDFELRSLRAVGESSDVQSMTKVIQEMFNFARLEIHSDYHTFKERMAPVFKGLCVVLETAVNLIPLADFDRFLEVVENCFTDLIVSLREIKSKAVEDEDVVNAKKIASAVGGFYLQCTSLFRSILGRAKLCGDDLVVARVLLLAERVLPLDTKGACNLYKKKWEDSSEDVVQGCTADVSLLMNMKEALKSPESVFKSGVAWTKFHTFVKDGMALLSREDQTSEREIDDPYPMVVLDRQFLSICPLTRSVRKRIAFQIAIGLHTVDSIHQGGEPLNENQKKQLENLKSSLRTLMTSLDIAELAGAVLATETVWLNWKYAAKEPCAPLEDITKLERGISLSEPWKTQGNMERVIKEPSGYQTELIEIIESVSSQMPISADPKIVKLRQNRKK